MQNIDMNAGEYNARLLAARDDASYRNDWMAQIDLSVKDYVRKNGFGELTFNFDGSQLVNVIHARLAGEFAVAHNVPHFMAWKATGLAAFTEWDARQVERVAA